MEMVDDYNRVPFGRNPNEWSMVAIHDSNKDDNYSVFPPINHENLHLNFSINHLPSSSSSSSSSSFSTSDLDTWTPSPPSSPFDSQVRKVGDFSGWVSLGFQILRSKVSSFRKNNRGAIWSIGLPSFALVILIIKMMWKKNIRRKNETRLINIIEEKDRRIAQLLHQIAQMNEILIGRHKVLAAKLVE